MAAPTHCERTRASAALAPDGELSPVELRLLDAHLVHCAGCRCFAERVVAVAEQLRAAALERSRRRVALPRVAPAPSAPNRT